MLKWLAEEKTIEETSIIIGCSLATVKKHRRNLYCKLEVPNAICAIRFYLDALAPVIA